MRLQLVHVVPENMCRQAKFGLPLTPSFAPFNPSVARSPFPVSPLDWASSARLRSLLLMAGVRLNRYRYACWQHYERVVESISLW